MDKIDPADEPLTQEWLTSVRRKYGDQTIGRRTVGELLDDIERLHGEQKSPAFDVDKLTADQLGGIDCVFCSASLAPMRPVGTHNGIQLFACISHDEQPAAEDWTAAESEGTEYHWMLCYIVPQVPYAFDARQRSGVITLTDETRAQAFEKLALRVAKEDGLSVGDFSVTSFSLEPNRLRPEAWGVLEWRAEPVVRLPQDRPRTDDLAYHLTLPPWADVEEGLREIYHSAPPRSMDGGPSMHTGLEAVYQRIQDMLVEHLVATRVEQYDAPAVQAQDGPCCDRRDNHYHCAGCGEVTGMYGHSVMGRIICDPGERRAYRLELALRPSGGPS